LVTSAIEPQQTLKRNIVAFGGGLWFHGAMASATPPPLPADLIRAAGAKVTRGRVRVLEALYSARQPLCHAELESQLGDGEAGIDRVTLYRVLDSLVEHGLALKAVDTRGVFRFSATGVQRQHASHIHFRCTDCGGVFCLKAEPPPPPRLPRGFRLGEVEFDVRGTCAGCSARDRS
jgi:Fur family ferric uptake transcriptional regulator